MLFFERVKKIIGWDSSNKITVVSFYLTLVPMVFSVFVYASVKIEGYLSSKISVDEVVKGEKDFDGVFSSLKLDRKIQISYPYVNALLSSDFIDGVNKEIEGNVLGAIQDNLVDYDVSYKVGVLSKRLISLSVHQYYYYEGGANGNGSEFALNFDPSKGRFFDFFDVFDARRDALVEVKKKILKKINVVCEYGVFDGKFDKASYIPRFFITKRGMEFVFSEYEVTPGVCGSFSVELLYKDISKYLKSDGPLGVLAPASGTWEAGDHFVNSIMESMDDLGSK